MGFEKADYKTGHTSSFCSLIRFQPTFDPKIKWVKLLAAHEIPGNTNI